MNLIKCQHCGGKHQDTDDNNKWTCDYCDKENKPKTNNLEDFDKWADDDFIVLKQSKYLIKDILFLDANDKYHRAERLNYSDYVLKQALLADLEDKVKKKETTTESGTFKDGHDSLKAQILYYLKIIKN